MAVDEPTGITKYFKKESETPPPKRAPSPPHEYVLAESAHCCKFWMEKSGLFYSIEDLGDALSTRVDTLADLSQLGSSL